MMQRDRVEPTHRTDSKNPYYWERIVTVMVFMAGIIGGTAWAKCDLPYWGLDPIAQYPSDWQSEVEVGRVLTFGDGAGYIVDMDQVGRLHRLEP